MKENDKLREAIDDQLKQNETLIKKMKDAEDKSILLEEEKAKKEKELADQMKKQVEERK